MGVKVYTFLARWAAGFALVDGVEKCGWCAMGFTFVIVSEGVIFTPAG